MKKIIIFLLVVLVLILIYRKMGTKKSGNSPSEVKEKIRNGNTFVIKIAGTNDWVGPRQEGISTFDYSWYPTIKEQSRRTPFRGFDFQDGGGNNFSIAVYSDKDQHYLRGQNHNSRVAYDWDKNSRNLFEFQALPNGNYRILRNGVRVNRMDNFLRIGGSGDTEFVIQTTY